MTPRSDDKSVRPSPVGQIPRIHSLPESVIKKENSPKMSKAETVQGAKLLLARGLKSSPKPTLKSWFQNQKSATPSSLSKIYQHYRPKKSVGKPALLALKRLARQGGLNIEYGEMAYGKLSCEVCGHSHDDDRMILCDNCDRGFHFYCVRPILVAVPKGSWFCLGCSGESAVAIQRKFDRVRDNFLADRPALLAFLKMDRFEEAPLTKRELVSLVGSKKAVRCRNNFRIPVPSVSKEQRWNQLALLAAALQVKGIQYVSTLQYAKQGSGGPLSKDNDTRRDHMFAKSKAMSRQNRKILAACSRLHSRGYRLPVVVRYHAIQGFVVVADGPILDRTLICEYVGEVSFLANHLHDDCDSLMDLLRTGRSKTSLVITPERKSNMARFISGVNNGSEASMRQQNVRSARFSVNGQAHVILFACRNISKGERLHYDYNALVKKGYPTEHFS